MRLGVSHPFTQAHLYALPQHLEFRVRSSDGKSTVPHHYTGATMQDAGYELPRIPLPRTWVNRLTGRGSHAALLTLRARSLRQVFRAIHREFIALIQGEHRSYK